MPYQCFFCKNLSGVLFLYTVGRRYTFRRYSGVPLEAKNAISQGAKSSRLRRRGVPVFTGGNKRGQDTKDGFLSPLDSPDLPLR